MRLSGRSGGGVLTLGELAVGEVEEVHEEISLVEEEEALEGHEPLLELEGAHEVLEQHA